jgi:hypothetical protein
MGMDSFVIGWGFSFCGLTPGPVLCLALRGLGGVSHTHDIFMKVTTTYTAPFNLDDHLTGTWLGSRDVVDTDVFLAIESCGSHRHGFLVGGVARKRYDNL